MYTWQIYHCENIAILFLFLAAWTWDLGFGINCNKYSVYNNRIIVYIDSKWMRKMKEEQWQRQPKSFFRWWAAILYFLVCIVVVVASIFCCLYISFTPLSRSQLLLSDEHVILALRFAWHLPHIHTHTHVFIYIVQK